MNHRAFTLMELMIVIVIIGILSAVMMVMFGDMTEKGKIAVVKQNCINTASAIGAKFGSCALSPYSHLELKSIGGRQTIEKVPCDKNKTNTGQMLNKIINHLNNEGFTIRALTHLNINSQK